MSRSIAAGTALVCFLAAGCGDVADDAAREAAIYAAVVRVVVPPPAEHEPETTVDHDVFLWGGGEGHRMGQTVQAAVIDELDEYERLRFVDERSEAVDDDAEGAPVRNRGVLVVLGAVPGRGDAVHVDVEVYVDEDADEAYDLRVERAAGRWAVVTALDPPPPVPPAREDGA